MIVNHSHKFIFVHVPKAAGTSVSELFSQFSAYSDLEVGGTELGEALQNAYKRRFGLTKHATAEEIQAVVGPATWRDYFSFAFVRDPYARAQSTFHFMKRWHGNKEMKQLAFMDEHPDFRSFVMSDTFLKQKAHRLLWPQAKWLVGADGQLAVDHVGRLESLDDDIHRVLSTAPGLVAAGAAPAAAPARNKSASTDAALYELLAGDAQVEQRVYEAYKVDFELFGYPRFDVASTPKPTAERTPNVAPILAKGSVAAGKGEKAGKNGNKFGAARKGSPGADTGGAQFGRGASAQAVAPAAAGAISTASAVSAAAHVASAAAVTAGAPVAAAPIVAGAFAPSRPGQNKAKPGVDKAQLASERLNRALAAGKELPPARLEKLRRLINGEEPNAAK